jgi:hypothetical protein
LCHILIGFIAFGAFKQGLDYRQNTPLAPEIEPHHYVALRRLKVPSITLHSANFTLGVVPQLGVTFDNHCSEFLQDRSMPLCLHQKCGTHVRISNLLKRRLAPLLSFHEIEAIRVVRTKVLLGKVYMNLHLIYGKEAEVVRGRTEVENTGSFVA